MVRLSRNLTRQQTVVKCQVLSQLDTNDKEAKVVNFKKYLKAYKIKLSWEAEERKFLIIFYMILRINEEYNKQIQLSQNEINIYFLNIYNIHILSKTEQKDQLEDG